MLYYLFGIALLAIVFLGLVFMRFQSPRRWWRLMASLAVLLGMALLVIPIPNGSSIANQSHLIVLTEGAQEDSVAAYSKSNSVKLHWDQLSQSAIDNAASIELFGYGIPDTSIWKIPPSKTRFHISPIPRGIASIHWRQEIALGQGILIQGRIHNPQKEILQLQLLSGLEIVEQKTLPAQANSLFQFNPSPKNLGTGNYQLLLLKGKDTLSKNHIPFYVTLPKPLSVLLLQDAPGFEQKFLKNWLTDQGYQLAARTRISKGIFDQSFSNCASSNLLNINANLLAGFDLLLTDEAALNSLSSMEQFQIRTAIREKGLGLLVTADTMIKHASLLDQGITLKTIFDSSASHHFLKMPGYDSAWHPQLSNDAWLVIAPNLKMQTLVTDAKGNLITGLYKDGTGKIGFSTLNQTHLWSLSSKQWDYSFYWTHLLESLASQQEDKVAITLARDLPLQGHPTEMIQWKDSADQPLAIVSGVKVYLKEDPLFSFQQKGRFWPNRIGWQYIVTASGQIKPWYVFDANDWLLLQWSQRTRQTIDWLAQPDATRAGFSTMEQLPSKGQPIPAIWAWMILLIGLTILWVESKLE